MSRTVLVTGASGYLGRHVVVALAAAHRVVAYDIRPPDDRVDGVEYVTGDVRSAALEDVLGRTGTRTVVHLAAIVSPGRRPDRDLEYSVDVLGTENVLRCSVAAGVDHLIVASSGAAYGYHADNPVPLREDDALRGNDEFAYARHKRLVEEMLAGWRERHPELRQLVFRPGTILGATARNQITNLFHRPFVLGLRGADSPFVFIWDGDVAACIEKGVAEGRSGIFNLAGDGVLTLREIAGEMGKPYVALPVPLVRRALAFLKRLHLTQYGPEQVDFLRYRPVLDNTLLKTEFGYVPQRTTAEVLALFRESHDQA